MGKPRKPNPMLARIEAEHEREKAYLRTFTIQQCVDMMLIATNDAFGFGADRLNRLEETFYDVFKEYAKMTLQDAKDDKRIEFTKDKLDRKPKQIMGDYFIPWEERYV